MRIEHWWFTLPLRLRSILRRNRVEQELDEEMQFHIDRLIEQNLANGMTPAEAGTAALRAMEGLTQQKEHARDTRRVRWLTDFTDDARYAFRTLRKSAALTAFVAITLAIAIGLTATSFSMVDGLIFRPYPVPHPAGVVSLVATSHDTAYDNFSYREYLDIRTHTKSYDGVMANAIMTAVGFSADPGATPRIRGGILVSGNYFRVLEVEPRLGRGFRPEEDQVPGRDAVVVLAWDFWKQEFAGDQAAIGKTVRLNGRDFTVIGVAPEEFPGLQLFGNPDLYVPLAMASVLSTNSETHFFEDRDDRELAVRARLRPGATLQQARGELAVLAHNFERDYPQLSRDRGAAVHTQFEMQTRDDSASPWKFMVMFAILALAVLLVACTNVAGLLLSRARSRSREIAVRLALGAGRLRLIRLLLTESLMMALPAGIGGIWLAYSVIRFLHTFAVPSELPFVPPFQMDRRVLIAGVLVTFLSAVACGLAPALQSARTDLVNGLKTADVDLPGRKRLWGRNLLVVAQVAMSLMLLMASFLMARGFRHGVDETTGFSKDHLLMARFDPRLVQYSETQAQQFYKHLMDRARAIPGVRSAALTENPPLNLKAFGSINFVPDGFQMPRNREHFVSTMDTVNESFFETMGVRILRGRAFLSSDSSDSARVAIVNQQFAGHYFPGADALGKRIRLNNSAGPAVEIVGIAETIKYRNTYEKPTDFVYLPQAQHPTIRMYLLMRSSVDPAQLVQPLKDAVHGLDTNMPILQTRTFEELYRYAAVDGPGIAVRMVGMMGGVGLLLAIAGLYGLVAYNVSRRTREIGIRMAIGASPRDVLRLVMGKGLTLVAIGAAIGVVLGFGIERMMNSMFNIGGVDITVYLVVVPCMIAATMLAAYAPARRAARIPPTQALRYE
jgi:putative ABC transport system permease protein